MDHTLSVKYLGSRCSNIFSFLFFNLNEGRASNHILTLSHWNATYIMVNLKVIQAGHSECYRYPVISSYGHFAPNSTVLLLQQQNFVWIDSFLYPSKQWNDLSLWERKVCERSWPIKPCENELYLLFRSMHRKAWDYPSHEGTRLRCLKGGAALHHSFYALYLSLQGE